MITVKQLLRNKKKQVWTIEPDSTVYEAVQLMIDKDVGALMVMESGKAVGIVTERDYARKLVLQERAPKETRVRDIMTERVLFVYPEQTMDECMALMTNKQIRHLPVLDNDKLVGLVSIRDVVRQVISEQEFMIAQLENYIMDRPPHMRV
jgi:IMP dehydrogenase